MTTTETGTGLHGETIGDPSGVLQPAPDGDTAFFGHPRGLGYLAGTELWERFSFYGMQALLMLYMTKYLLLPERAGHVAGLSAYRAMLEAIFGPMTDLALAAQTFGLYSGLILLTPLIGAWLGDRVLGRARTVTIGALLMAAGHITMASERLFLLALLLLILGGGCFIANLAAQVGGLYHPTDTRRTRAFGIYLMALNVGALASPLIVGTLGEKVGFHWGFGATGIGMLIGLATYLFGRRHLPPDRVVRGVRPAPLTREQWIATAALMLTFIPRLPFMAAAQQAYGIMVVWADTAVDRHIGDFVIPVTWVLTADGILTICGVLLANRIWAGLSARSREPNDLYKMAIGCAMVTAAFVSIGLFAALPSVPVFGWLAFYLILTMSYAWYDPPSKALIARFAPSSVNGTMFALSSASSALGFFLLGWLGRFYEPLGASRYFLLTALLPAGAGLALLLVGRAILRVLERGEQAGQSGVPDEPIAQPA